MLKTSVNIEAVPYKLISSSSELPLLAEALKKAVRVAVDTETHKALTLEDGTWAALRVISIAILLSDGSHQAFVIDVRDVNVTDIAEVFKLIEVADAWNADFDERILKLAGCPVAQWRDAMFADGVLHTGSAGFDFYHPLSWASVRYLGVEMSGKGSTQTSFDGTSDLTEEQVRYAAHDAIITLLIAIEQESIIKSAGLEIPVANEHAARPAVLSMKEHGFPFEADLWDKEVVLVRKEKAAEALAEIRDLTGGGEMTLFGEAEGPSWDVNSDSAMRKALNEYATTAVKAYTNGRLLGPEDRMDKTTLQQIVHPLCVAILEYKSSFKVVSTYGDNLREFLSSDGRVRAIYRQGGLTATGRLRSEKPNGQNLDPDMKAYMRARDRVDENGVKIKRAFVHADYSQAEVRALAQITGERNLIELFEKGGDFHSQTAAKMFKVDFETLLKEDPERASKIRTSTKKVSFGIPYGNSASTLAKKLTVEDKIETSVAEGQQLIKAYLEVNPDVDAWLSARDKFIRDFAKNPPAVDWQTTFELYDLYQKADSVKRSFKNSNGRFPSMLELSQELMSDSELNNKLQRKLGREITDADREEERSRQVQELMWVLNFTAPVVIGVDGQPVGWESRTLTGRRRIFQIPVDRVSKGEKGKTEGVLFSFALSVGLTEKEAGSRMRDEFAKLYNLDLPKGTDRTPRQPGENDYSYRQRRSEARKREKVQVMKAFEGSNRWLKRELLRFLVDKMGQAAVEKYLLLPALSEQVSQMANQFRNHPIQGLVTDIVLEAMALINEKLSGFKEAFIIQQVHDSVAIECDLEDAEEISSMVKTVMEDVMRKWCPLVPPKADTEIGLTFAKEGIISPEEIPALLAA